MRVADVEPVVGQGLCLVQYEGLPGQYEQYVRVTAVASVETQFTFNNQDITRKVVTVEISDPLRYDFNGPTVQQHELGNTPLAICRDTRVADAANYFGVTDLEANAAINDAQLQVASIFTQLVPSAQTETPIIDANAAGESTGLVAGNDGTVTGSFSVTVGTSQSLYIGSAIMPGTLSFTIFGQSVTDLGGVLKNSLGTQVGNVNYQSGQITWLAAAGSGFTTLTITFKPAAVPTQPSQSYAKPVTADNRGYNWPLTLVPIPAPGTLVVSYQAQGKVYELRDNGAGQLVGADSAFGSGTVSFSTGSVNFSTGALPDFGTPILYQWGSPLSTFQRADLPVLPAALEFDLQRQGVAAGTVTVSWLLNGVSKTATSTTAGTFTGDATGTINHAAGTGRLVPTLLPQANTQFTFNYSYGTPLTQTIDDIVPDGGQELTFTIGSGADLIPGSIELTIPVQNSTFAINGNVMLTDVPVNSTTGNLVNSNGVVQGTVNYETGEVIVTPVTQKTEFFPAYVSVIYTAS